MDNPFQRRATEFLRDDDSITAKTWSGYLLARICISLLFLPHYFRGDLFTAYELMRRRFGERVRKLTASIFLVTRALAEGVRVFAISLVISIILTPGFREWTPLRWGLACTSR